MNKKGYETLIIWAVYLVFVAIVVFSAIFEINRVASLSSFEDRYVAVDISLLLDTIQFSPGKLDLNYKYGERELAIKDGKVISNKASSTYISNINQKLLISNNDNILIIKN